MITRLIIIVTFALLYAGCNAETKEPTPKPQTSTISKSDTQIEGVFHVFSTAISSKNLSLLLSITEPSGIHLVRSFTSGNLGGRGASLNESISPSKINAQLAFPIPNQTSFDLPPLFTSLPITSISTLPERSMDSDFDTTPYAKWEGILKKSLANTPEVENGDPIILVSTSKKYWVYAEAQIIDNILVGGFAVFSKQNEKWKLFAVINLL